MGCSQFNDKFEELGVLLNEYEKNTCLYYGIDGVGWRELPKSRRR